MNFSTLFFVFAFLPVSLILYLICPRVCKNALLVLISFVFYAWGSPIALLLLLCVTVFNYCISRARSWISVGDYVSALSALNAVSEYQRGAQWYYLAAIANFSLGNRVLGYEQINRACALDPDNAEYQHIKAQIEHGAGAYSDTQRHMHFTGADASRACCGMCLAYNASRLFCGNGLPFCLFC